MPKISVIIPIYNAEKYLRKCLDSVINQSFKDIEIICVDDGSTDSTKSILEEYSKKDSRIIVINQQNLYAGVARNNGIKIAKGDYIHFLDSDDWIKKNTYKYLYKKILKNKVDLILFQYITFNVISKRIVPERMILKGNKKISNIKENPEFFMKSSLVVPWNKFYSKQFIIDNNLSFDPIIASNDKTFYIHTLLKAKKIMVSRKSLIYHRVNNKDSLVGEIRFKNYECHFKCYESIRKISENATIEEKSMFIDSTMKSFLYFYHKSYGEYKNNIYEKLHNYFQTMDMSPCEEKHQKYEWWDEYVAIKLDDKNSAEKLFNNNIEKENENKYISKIIKHIKENGIFYTIYLIFLYIIFKLKRKKYS